MRWKKEGRAALEEDVAVRSRQYGAPDDHVKGSVLNDAKQGLEGERLLVRVPNNPHGFGGLVLFFATRVSFEL